MADPKETYPAETKDEEKRPELDKLQAAAASVEQFFKRILNILTKPVSHFKTLSHSEKPLDVQAWLFAVLSITASSYIFEIIALPKGEKVAFIATYAITLTCWSFYGLVAHLFCRVLGGKATIQKSISAVLQISSLASMLSMVAAFLVWNLRADKDPLIATAAYAFVELVLCSVYFGLALGTVHAFGRSRKIAAGIFLGILFVALNILFFLMSFVVGGGADKLGAPPT